MNNEFLYRCIDNAAWLVIGIFGLLFYPRKIRSKVQAGRLSAAQGKKNWMVVSTICYIAIAIGVLRIFQVLR